MVAKVIGLIISGLVTLLHKVINGPPLKSSIVNPKQAVFGISSVLLVNESSFLLASTSPLSLV